MTDARSAAYETLLLRVTMGVLFIAHGLLKVLVFTPAGTVGFSNRWACRAFSPI